MRLEGKVALVTGAGSGIGAATSRLFAAEGAAVGALDRDGARARATADAIGAAGGTALALEADVSNPADVGAAIARTLSAWGRLDVLVNNAAVAGGDDILEIDDGDWDSNLAVVLKSVFLCSKAALPAMIEQRSGSMVNISSVNGLIGLGEEAYSAAKAGVINLTRNVAVRYGRFGVRANCICPGTIRTPVWRSRLERDPQIFERLAEWYPLGRVGEPEDPARAALFLASDEAAWITGSTLVVDGGLLAGSHRMALALEAKPDEHAGA
jgi:meso-butanediol dehydrogenase/(S,S)-butanediol dehydrogenase/diacetyl reductase